MLTAEEADVVGAEACDERPSYLLRSHWRRLRPPQPPPLLSRQSANAVGAAAAATLAPTGDVAALVACLAGLQGELRAYLFFFLEARYLAYVATTCLSLYRALWDDVVFWSAYAGPCLAAPCKLSRASPVESFQAPEKIKLVQWVKDPIAAKDAFYTDARTRCIWVSLIYFFLLELFTCYVVARYMVAPKQLENVVRQVAGPLATRATPEAKAAAASSLDAAI
eukprot:TRINITY_DN3238_c0_g1_i2.p2 TRINITY_DN3238_c0_g1~~TRINITY_DN3238_c0_g1_i2.p2  ORF type:complete len:254 (-),score=64.02 TRINITY_DN3238_c0_g1_i2:39-707(-)